MRVREDMTLTELRDLARERGIKGAAKLRKPELIEALAATDKPSKNGAAGPKTPASPKTVAAAPAVATPPRQPAPPPDAHPAERTTSSTLLSAAGPPRAGQEAAAPHRQAKFDQPQPRDEARFEEDLGFLPDSYGVDRLVLLTRDPEWAFCYWEITHTLVNATMAGLADPQPVLRVYARDAEDAPETSYDEATQIYGRRHYLRVPAPGRIYRVELGFLGRDGSFAAAMASNDAVVPPADVSPVIDDRFVSVVQDEPLKAQQGTLAEVTPPAAWKALAGTTEEYRRRALQPQGEPAPSSDITSRR